MISVRLAVLAAAGVIGAATLPVLTAQSPTRLIAIGDIHGSYDGITTILRRAGLVDDALKWSGGRRSGCRPATTPTAAPTCAR